MSINTELDERERSSPAIEPGNPTRRRAGLRRWFTPDRVVFITTGPLVAYLCLTPVLFLGKASVIEDGRFVPSNLVEAFTNPDFPHLLVNTLILAVFVPIFSIMIGTVLAYLFVRTDVPFKRLLFVSAVAPMAIPSVIYAISWVFLLSPKTGLFNVLATNLGLPTYDIFGRSGMVLVASLHGVPIVFLFMYAAFRASDPSLEESAAMSGATKWQVFRRVSLPLVKPALAAVLLLQVVRSLESFEVPAVIGMPAGELLITSEIYMAREEYPINYGLIGSQAIGLVAVIAIGIWLLVTRGRMGRGAETVGGKGFRPRELSLGRWRWTASFGVVVFFVVAVAGPLLILVYASMQPYYAAPSWDRLTSSNLDNYKAVLQSANFGKATWNTMIVSVAAATATTALAALVSWLVLKGRMGGRSGLEMLIWLPMAFPSVILGLALLAVYPDFPIQVYGTLWLLLIAYGTLFLPYAFQYVNSSMYQISGELEEAAHMSGASWGAMFRRVILPLLIPGLLASWLYVFIHGVRELGASVLLYSPKSIVLPVRLWQLYQDGDFNAAAALGVMLVLFLLIVTAILRWVERKFSVYST